MNNDKTPGMEGFKEGMRGVDREDNPVEVPGRNKNITEKIKETFGFQSQPQSTISDTAQTAQNKASEMSQTAQSKASDISQLTQNKVSAAADDITQTMDSTQTGSKMHASGSRVMEAIDRQTQGKEIGGNQLFGEPKGVGREGVAGNSFLSKYANESAPAENSA